MNNQTPNSDPSAQHMFEINSNFDGINENLMPEHLTSTEAYLHFCHLLSRLTLYERERFLYEMLCQGIDTMGLDGHQSLSKASPVSSPVLKNGF